MSYNDGLASVNEINRRQASTDNYVSVDFQIKKTDEEKRNVISSTFGVIKNNLESLWYSVGLDPNVNMEYQKIMSDPQQSFEVQGKRFYPQSGVGKIQAYNEMGNPSGGCFTMHTLA